MSACVSLWGNAHTQNNRKQMAVTITVLYVVAVEASEASFV